MKDIQYHELKHGPIDPNRARWYAVGLSALGALFAFLTIKTNWDYFSQYYDGFAFWARVVPFFATEAAIIILPLFKGFGNKSQGNTAMICEVVLIALALTHTYLVSDASIAKLQAGKTKTEATADFTRTQAVADRVAATNQQLQRNYNQQMRFWNDAARIARLEGRSAPPPPQAPKLQDVPQIGQNVISNSLIAVEMAGEARVSHQTLQFLLYLMIGLVTVSMTSVVLLADGSILRGWLLSQRAARIKETTGAATSTLGGLLNTRSTQPLRQVPNMSPAPVVQTPPQQPPGKP